MKSIYQLLLPVLLIMGGCSVPRIQETNEKTELPAGFRGAQDTVSSAEVSRRVIYPSKHLADLIDTVIRNNYDQLMAVQRIRAAQAYVTQARSFMAPQVNIAAVPAIRKFGLYTMDGAGNAATDIKPGVVVPEHLPDFFFGVQASWEVDLFGKLKNRNKAAVARFFASREGLNLLHTNLVAETAGLYYELLAADQDLRVLDQTIQLQEEAIELVKVQKQAAVVNELAVQQFEAQLLSMRSMRLDIQQLIIALETRLNMLAGRLYQPIKRDTSFFAEGSLPLIKEGLPAALLRNRPDIKQAEWALAATKADLRSARAAFFPSLNLLASVGIQGYDPSILFRLPESIAYSLVAGLAAPLLNKRFIKGEFARAEAEQMEAMYRYKEVVTRSYNEVFEELSNINNLQQVYQLKQLETAKLYQSIQTAAELFRTGRADYLEVLITRQNALRTNMELITTRKNQYLAAINLYKALGGGREMGM